MRRLVALAGLFGAVLGVASACTSNHDILRAKGSGGSGGSAATGGSAGDAASDVASDAPADVFVEPTGKSVLTLVHGVVDAEHLAFCFSKVQDGVPADPVGPPLPLGGLVWGGSVSIESISGLDWSKDDIELIVIAGDFALLAGKSCSDAVALAASYEASYEDAASSSGDASLDAGDAGDAGDAAVELPPPPPLRAAELPVVPAGTLSGGYSTLLVAAGCIGGPAFADSLDQLVCGSGYGPKSPTLTPVLVQLSRLTAPDKVGLQALNASLPSDPVSFDSMPPEGSSLPSVDFASSVSFGALSPRPPELGYSQADLGGLDSRLEVSTTSSTLPVFSSTWQSAFAASGQNALSNGQSYAVIFLGPQPNVPTSGKWWNPPRFVVVPTSP